MFARAVADPEVMMAQSCAQHVQTQHGNLLIQPNESFPPSKKKNIWEMLMFKKSRSAEILNVVNLGCQTITSSSQWLHWIDPLKPGF